MHVKSYEVLCKNEHKVKECIKCADKRKERVYVRHCNTCDKFSYFACSW